MNKTQTALTTVLITAGSLLAETGPTQTDDYSFTERTGASTCQLASRWSCLANTPFGSECPTCTVDKTGYREVMRLNFPDDKITCVEGKVRVPDNVDLAKPFNVRFATTRVGGIAGNNTSGTCVGGCAILDYLMTPVLEGNHLANYLWMVDTSTGYIRYYSSEAIPGGGVNAQGKLITAIVSSIFPVDVGLVRGAYSGVRVCRDGRDFHGSDTQPGTIGMDSMYIVWPVNPNPVESATVKTRESAPKSGPVTNQPPEL